MTLIVKLSIAWVCQWWHCLLGIFSLFRGISHRGISGRNFEDGVRIIACECGKVFYGTDGYKDSSIWESLQRWIRK